MVLGFVSFRVCGLKGFRVSGHIGFAGFLR